MDLFCFCVGRIELKALQYIPEICHYVVCRTTRSGQQDKIEEDYTQRIIWSLVYISVHLKQHEFTICLN